MPTLNWIGKDAVINHHLEVPFRLLKDVPELGCGDAGSGNLIVEGDNLVALKALLPYYKGKVKCICIDPPYNTGNEGWAYNDNVNSPAIKTWLGETVGKEGETLDRHDRWLCMMYPRLALLREFLTKDGVILVHIDDYEIQNLRAIMDEIFWRKNFVTQFIWQTDGHTDNQFHVKVNHEYIVMYARHEDSVELGYVVDPNTREESNLWKGIAENSITKNGPGNPPSEVTLPVGFPVASPEVDLPPTSIPAGLLDGMTTKKMTSNKLKAEFGKVQFPLRYDRMKGVGGKLVEPCRVFSGWANANKLKQFIAGGCTPFADHDGLLVQFYLSKKGVIYYRKDRGDRARHILSVLQKFTTTEKTSSQLKLMGLDFSYPKPVDLTRYLIRATTNPGDTVLDSFAGSGTVGASVLHQNAEQEDEDARKFILVQMPQESLEQLNAGLNLTRDRTRFRVNQVASGYTTPKGEKVPGLGGGFRYVTLGDELFDEHGRINETKVRFADLARHVYFTETGEPLPKERISAKTPLLGIHHGRAVYLLYNGILKDKSVDGGNVLTGTTLEHLPAHDGPKVVYAAGCRFSKARLEREDITFKQTPYGIRTR